MYEGDQKKLFELFGELVNRQETNLINDLFGRRSEPQDLHHPRGLGWTAHVTLGQFSALSMGTNWRTTRENVRMCRNSGGCQFCSKTYPDLFNVTKLEQFGGECTCMPRLITLPYKTVSEKMRNKSFFCICM